MTAVKNVIIEVSITGLLFALFGVNRNPHHNMEQELKRNPEIHETAEGDPAANRRIAVNEI